MLNIAGLLFAIVTGRWRLRQIYDVAYFPIAATMWMLGAFGWLPRVKASTKGEGHERRYFYGSVWAVSVAQPVLWLLWQLLPESRSHRHRQARRFRRHAGVGRQPCALGSASAHAPHRARRAGRFGLADSDARARRRLAPLHWLNASVMNASMSAAGRAPAVRATSRPRANTAMVGIERIPRRSTELLDRVCIDLHDKVAPGVGSGHPRDLWRDHVARATPRSPEIHDDGNRRMRDERIERRRIGNLERFAGE